MTKTYSMPKDFYWGGASAANQYEGGYKDCGKGLNAVDVLTNGSANEPRKVTWKTADGKTGSTPMVWEKNLDYRKEQNQLLQLTITIQVMREQTSITTIKKILNIWLIWALICSAYH